MRNAPNTESKASTAVSQKSLKKGVSNGISSRVLTEPIDTLIVVPPDGGWGWVIVACAFYVMMVNDGIAFSYGLFLTTISESMNCTKGEVSIASSILTACFFICGPLISALVNRFGFRIVCISGAVICGIGLVGTSMAPQVRNYLFIFFTYGLLCGVGMSMMYTSSILIVGFYFQKWRALATGVSSCGSSIGNMVFPPIVQNYMQDSWTKAFQIFALVVATNIIPAILYRPLKPVRVVSSVNPPEKLTTFIEEDEESYDENAPRLRKAMENLHNTKFPTALDLHDTSTVTLVAPTKHSDYGTPFESVNPSRISVVSAKSQRSQRSSIPQRRLPINKLSVNSGFRSETASRRFLGEDYYYLFCPDNKCCMPCNICLTKHCYRKKIPPTVTTSRPLYKDDIFYHGSVARLEKYQKYAKKKPAARKVTYNMSVTRVSTQRDYDNRCHCCPDSVARTLATMCDIRLMKQTSFLLLLISGTLTYTGMLVPYSFVVDRSITEKIIEEKRAAFLLTTIGAFNGFGRILNGAISCIPNVDLFMITWINLILCGLWPIVYNFVKNDVGAFVFCGLYGFGVATVCIRSILIVDLVGLDKLTNAFGMMMLFHGVGSLINLSGAVLADYYGYDAVFYFCGATILASGILIIPVKYIKRKEMKRDAAKPNIRFNVR